MRHFAGWVFLGLAVLMAPPAFGQYMTVSGTNLTDASGVPVASATITFAPVLANGQPLSFRKGTSGGQTIVRPVTATVTNGAFTVQLVDSSQTMPANACYSATVIDNITGASLLGAGYGCVQPNPSATAWCSGTTCNFDAYPPNLAAILPVVTGPTGATGPVELAPNGSYVSSSSLFTIPNQTSAPYISYPTLDCHGSTLTYTGAGETFTVLGENDHKSMEIRNCKIVATNPAATAHIWSRLDLRISHSSFILGLTGITEINDLAHGGLGYSEEHHWDDVQITVPANGCGITFREDPSILGNTGIGSFFYPFMKGVHFDLNGGSQALCLRAAAGAPQPWIAGGNIEIDVNAGGNNNTAIYLENGTAMTRGTVILTGENTGGGTGEQDVYAGGNGALFDNFGNSYITGFSHGYGSGASHANINFVGGQQPISNDSGTFYGILALLNGETGAIGPQRQSKNIQGGNQTIHYLANYGGAENDGIYQIATRVTTDPYPDVDVAGASGNPITNIFYTDALTQNVGIGAGFAKATNMAGIYDKNKPLTSLEVRGSGFTVRNPLLGVPADGGAYMTRYVDSGGNIVDYLLSGSISGQPTNYYKQSFRSYITLSPVDGMLCYAAATTICNFPRISVNARTPASSTEGCVRGQILIDDSYIYACTAALTWVRSALTAF